MLSEEREEYAKGIEYGLKLQAENDQLRARLHNDEQRITAQQERNGELQRRLMTQDERSARQAQMLDELTAQLAEARETCQRVHQWLNAKWERPLSDAENALLLVLERVIKDAGMQPLSIQEMAGDTAGSEGE